MPSARPRAHLTARTSVLAGGLLAGLVATLVALLTAGQVAVAAGEPTAVAPALALAALALAAAALVHLTLTGARPARPAAGCPGGPQPAPALASRVADPVHHPVRPRAPGTV